MKKRYGIIVAIITAIILYIILKDDYKTILNLLLSINIWWFFVGIFLVAAHSFFKALILKEIVSKFKKYSLFDALKLQMMSLFFNAITPFSSGGQPLQVYQLKKDGIRINKGTNIVIQGTVINQLALITTIIIIVIINLIFKIYPVTPALLFLVLLGAVLNLIIFSLTVLVSYNRKVSKNLLKFIITVLNKLKIYKNKEETMDKWNSSLDNFHEGSKLLFNDKPHLFKLVIYNILAYLTTYLVPLTVLFCFGNYTAYNGLEAIVITSFTTIVGSYVPLPGGSGGQEYMFITLFSKYITNPLLSSVMLLWRFMTYYLPMIIGAIIFNLKGDKKCE